MDFIFKLWDVKTSRTLNMFEPKYWIGNHKIIRAMQFFCRHKGETSKISVAVNLRQCVVNSTAEKEIASEC